MAASAEEMRLSTKRSEGASRFYFNRVVDNSELTSEPQPGGASPSPTSNFARKGASPGTVIRIRSRWHKAAVDGTVTPLPLFFCKYSF